MSVEDDATRRALHAFVEALVDEGLTPEAAVIALKEALGRAHYLYRFEPLVREHLRTSLVSECIDHYFIALGTDHLIPPARASMSLEHAPERARRNDAETSR